LKLNLKKRQIELLKRSQKLKNQGKSLYREQDVELSEYKIAVSKHLFWQKWYNILLSMENFLNGKIDGEKVCDKVYGL